MRGPSFTRSNPLCVGRGRRWQKMMHWGGFSNHVWEGCTVLVIPAASDRVKLHNNVGHN